MCLSVGSAFTHSVSSSVPSGVAGSGRHDHLVGLVWFGLVVPSCCCCNKFSSKQLWFADSMFCGLYKTSDCEGHTNKGKWLHCPSTVAVGSNCNQNPTTSWPTSPVMWWLHPTYWPCNNTSQSGCIKHKNPSLCCILCSMGVLCWWVGDARLCCLVAPDDAKHCTHHSLLRSVPPIENCGTMSVNDYPPTEWTGTHLQHHHKHSREGTEPQHSRCNDAITKDDYHSTSHYPTKGRCISSGINQTTNWYRQRTMVVNPECQQNKSYGTKYRHCWSTNTQANTEDERRVGIAHHTIVHAEKVCCFLYCLLHWYIQPCLGALLSYVSDIVIVLS